MHRQRWIIVLAAVVITSSLPLYAGQEPGSSPAPQSTAPSSSPASSGNSGASGSSSSSSKARRSHADDVLIRGTVFDDRGLAVPAVKLRIRRADEKKSHWETYSNSRGEFAVRVPPGWEYQMEAQGKGFATQTQTVHGKVAGVEEKVIFHLERSNGGKK